MKIFGSNRREAVSGMCNLLNEQLVTLNQMWNLERRVGVQVLFAGCNNDLDVGGRVILKWMLRMLPL
jgi:hypothetical protein